MTSPDTNNKTNGFCEKIPCEILQNWVLPGFTVDEIIYTGLSSLIFDKKKVG